MNLKEIDKGIIAIVILSLVYTYITLNVISEFKQLPSPVYGGDYYYQLGGVYHLYENPITSWFTSSNMQTGMPGYLPLYPIAVTIFGKLTGLAPIGAMFYSNIVWPLLALLSFYFLLKMLVKNSALSVLGSAYLVGVTAFPILKYTDFTQYIIIPIFFIALYRFFEKQNDKNSIILGVTYGAMGLAHATSFFYASFMIISVFAYLVYKKYEWKINDGVKEFSKPFAYSFGLGFVISLVLWFEPIFIHHGQSKLLNNVFAFPDTAKMDIGIGILIDGLRGMFFNMGNLFGLVVGLLALACLITVFKNKELRSRYEFLIFLFVSGFVFVYSYLITSPLFDIHMIPTYSQGLFLGPIVIIMGLAFLGNKMEEKPKLANIALILLAVLLVFNITSGYDAWYKDRWKELGRNYEISPYLKSLQTYLLSNTNVNDVFLTNNEQGFALNAISGRKLVVSRRSQNDPFLDFDSRELDASIILYGNDIETKKTLLKKYNIEYIYFDASWINNEFYITQEGGIVPGQYIDPYLIVYSKEREDKLKMNGVKYSKIRGYIDPSIRESNIRKFDLLLITPDNYDMNGKGIWKTDIDPYLTQVWSYSENGQTFAVLYKVTI